MSSAFFAKTFRQINERNVHGSIRVGRSLLHEWFPKIDFQVKVWVLLLLFWGGGAAAVRHHAGKRRKIIIPFLWMFVWFAETQYFGYTGRVMERAFEACNGGYNRAKAFALSRRGAQIAQAQIEDYAHMKL